MGNVRLFLIVPGIMGSVDGTLITVTGVSGTEAEKHQFRPRLRKTFALNVMIMCDYRGKIIAFDATAKGRLVQNRTDG